MKNMKITITGLGYVGLVTVAGLASKEYKIIGYDINKDKISKLNNNVVPIFEPGLEDYLNKYAGNIIYTNEKEKAYIDSDIIFVCVNTPEKDNGEANLSYLYSAIDDICENINKDCIIVLKSTIPVTTTNSIQKYIYEKKLKYDIKVSFSPEFLAQGTAINDFLNGSRIVIGSNDLEVINTLKQIYSKFENSKIVVTDPNSAEMIKYASNTFLALKISYINEIANLCDVIGANIDDVALGVGLDERIGNKYLRPGIGFGGSCLQKDVNALQFVANKYGTNLKVIDAINDINASQKEKLIEKLDKYISNLESANIAILGLSYKPNTDDLRYAPSIDSIKKILDKKANIKVWDPVAINNCKSVFSNIKFCNTIDNTIENTDACLIFTEWDEIKNYEINNFSKYMKKPLILDGRNCFDLKMFEGTNTIYDSIGRGKNNE